MFSCSFIVDIRIFDNPSNKFSPSDRLRKSRFFSIYPACCWLMVIEHRVLCFLVNRSTGNVHKKEHLNVALGIQEENA